jgi:NADH-quinone oxidoreductase chain G
MITVTINGKEIKLEKPVTVLEAARSAGIKIPTLCWHEQLERYGGCRLCLVEVEKIPRLQTACTLMVIDGMVIRTETEQIADVRRGILEFLLINHPLDCPVCDKAGECELQDLVEKYGAASGRFKEEKRKVAENFADPLIIRNMERCVMCTRCVRMCEGVQGASAIDVIDRGGHSHIEPFSGEKYDCEYCGNCISVCPVGAIMSRLHRHSYRPWQMTGKTETICPYCGVGCTLVLQVRDDGIKRVISKIGAPVNNGLLCSRGKFGYEFVGNKERLTEPLIKKNGILEKATWEEAISLVAGKFKEIKGKHGGSSIAGIASPRCTNEDNYVFQKFMRVTLGTNNIDSAARTGFAGSQSFMENIFGQGATANLIPDLSNSDLILVVGGDPTAVNPILGLQIRACSRKGGKVLTIGKVKGFKFFNHRALNPKPYTDAILFEGIVTALKAGKKSSESNTPLEAMISDINIPVNEIEDACNISESDFSGFMDMLSASLTPSIVIGKEIIQSNGGSYKLMLLSAIKHLINAKIYLLSERANEQGLLDMGCTPDMLPGYMPVSHPESRKKIEEAWKAAIPDKPGLSIFEMVDSAAKGSIKAMYVMGENPAYNLPDSKSAESALKNIGFLVVQDIFLTETGRLADVVLPALSWAEKDGTFTNMERRIQRVRKAVNRDGMEDWRIIAEISRNMGVKFGYLNAEEIFNEMCMVSPLYKGMTYKEIESGKALSPYKSSREDRIPGKIQIHKGAKISADNKLYLRLKRPLFHSGTLSTKSSSLLKICGNASAKISPATAQKLSLKEGDMARLSTKAGSLEIAVNIDKGLDNSFVMLSNNFEAKGAFSLMEYSVDPVTGAPCIDNNEVVVEKVKV